MEIMDDPDGISYRLPDGRGSVSICKQSVPILIRARQQAVSPLNVE